MESNKVKFNYYQLKFHVYQIEVGVFLDKDNAEYDCYNEVYDKKHSYYDENVVFTLDYMQAVEYAKNYVNNGVNGTYAIVSKINYDSEKIYGANATDYEMELVSQDIINILGGGFIDNYIDTFGGKELYEVNNVIYSLCKERNKENPYYLGKGNGNIVENFIDKGNEVDYE